MKKVFPEIVIRRDWLWKSVENIFTKGKPSADSNKTNVKASSIAGNER